MATIDWIVLIAYIVLIIGMGWLVGRRQCTQLDYYLGGRSVPAWQVALSVLATQASAISLIGAPAFIALREGGGLVWLQYEFAIPLAMIGIMGWLLPEFRRHGDTTIYEYLERRFGRATRMSVSAVFLISRALGSGVALLATGIIASVCLGLPLRTTVLLIGGVAIIYTTQGGILADIYSDIIQLAVLWAGTILTAVILWGRLGNPIPALLSGDSTRLLVFNLHSTGLGDGQNFAFWPMLLGGFFLYLSYYGCDQSQAQRLLTTTEVRQAQKSLLVNGVLRFPLVLCYCSIGVLMIPYLHQFPEFAARLKGVSPDFLVPYFLQEHIPAGVLGLIVAGIFAASMSSLDSALNSLSAVTWTDFLARWRPSLESLPPARQVRISRWLTILWGVVSTLFAVGMIGGPETVLETVNKIGSAFYGPILAVFLLGTQMRGTRQSAVLVGLAAGVGGNLYLWLFQPGIAWMWWNVAGFALALSAGFLGGMLPGQRRPVEYSPPNDEQYCRPRVLRWHVIVLIASFAVALLISAWIEHLRAA